MTRWDFFAKNKVIKEGKTITLKKSIRVRGAFVQWISFALMVLICVSIIPADLRQGLKGMPVIFLCCIVITLVSNALRVFVIPYNIEKYTDITNTLRG